MKKYIVIIIALSIATIAQAQMALGFVAGVNMSNEVTTFNGAATAKSASMDDLKGLVIGPTLEMMLPKIDLGVELSTFYSRKGSNFNYSINYPANGYDIKFDGYKSIDYLEVPVYLKWKFGPPEFKGFVSAGLYWGFGFNGDFVVENAYDLLNNGAPIPELVKSTKMSFGYDKTSPFKTIDTGYSVGLGIEILRTLQFGVYYSYGDQSIVNEKSMSLILADSKYNYKAGDFNISSKNSVYTMRLTYFFSTQGN